MKKGLLYLFLLLTAFVNLYGFQYVVKKDDTLWDISKRFNVSIATIKKINDLFREELVVNQKLVIPVSIESYTVKSGDNLISLAKKFQSKLEYIILYNNLASESIYEGQKILIPVTEATESAKPEGDIKNPKGLEHVTIKIAEIKTHEVQKGDSLSSIAVQYNSRVEWIQVYNQLKGDWIYIGQKLQIPVPEEKKSEVKRETETEKPKDTVKLITYTVKSGDTLSQISTTYHLDMDKILEWNKKKSTDIYVGENLKLYVKVQTEALPKQKNDVVALQNQEKANYKLVVAPDKNYAFPVDVKLVQSFSLNQRGATFSMNKACDVRSMNHGLVEYVGKIKGYDRVIIVKTQDDKRMVYGFLTKSYVRKGDLVQKGEVIGSAEYLSFAEGVQLYLEMRQNKTTINILDVFPFLKTSVKK